MSNIGQLIDNAVEAAKKAVQYDEQGESKISAYYYEAAARLLEQAAMATGPEKGDSLKEKAQEYKNRSTELTNKSPVESKIVEGDTNKTRLKRCYFLLQQAIDEDELGDKEDAVELYAKAIEYITQFPDLMQGDLKTLTLQALDRAEELKGRMVFFVYLY